MWLRSYRFIYNETIWMLNGRYVKPNWMSIKVWLIPELKQLYPWIDCPRAIMDGAVMDACQSIINAIKKYKTGQGHSFVKYKSRKEPQQSFPLRNDNWSKDGKKFFSRLLGDMKFSSDLPEKKRDGRVIQYAGKWYVAIPVSTNTTRTENQGRLVALDPGIRSFQTFFSDSFAGHLGKQDIQRITRLAFHLDKLLSRRDLCKNKKRKTSMSMAAMRIREKIKNLVSELHWKVARFLTVNFDVILLPTFESKEMTIKTNRRIRKKSVRSLLSFSHYLFSQRLEQKCFEFGKRLIRICEAYTSKTASWTGEVKNISGAKWITSNGIKVERDLNGARGIFLRALVDSPILLKQGAC